MESLRTLCLCAFLSSLLLMGCGTRPSKSLAPLGSASTDLPAEQSNYLRLTYSVRSEIPEGTRTAGKLAWTEPATRSLSSKVGPSCGVYPPSLSVFDGEPSQMRLEVEGAANPSVIFRLKLEDFRLKRATYSFPLQGADSAVELKLPFSLGGELWRPAKPGGCLVNVEEPMEVPQSPQWRKIQGRLNCEGMQGIARSQTANEPALLGLKGDLETEFSCDIRLSD